MNLGIIGTGTVGQALASAFTDAGHTVVFGSRDPATTTVTDSDVVTQRTAAERSEVVVLALPASAATAVAAELSNTLEGKIVVDAANEYPSATAESSLAARIANAAPGAQVVKAFNTIGANRMTQPVIAGEQATLFLAGDDETAVETVATLAADIGFDPLVAGGLSAASHLEHLARFWIHLSQQQGRDIGFRLLQER